MAPVLFRIFWLSQPSALNSGLRRAGLHGDASHQAPTYDAHDPALDDHAWTLSGTVAGPRSTAPCRRELARETDRSLLSVELALAEVVPAPRVHFALRSAARSVDVKTVISRPTSSDVPGWSSAT